MMAEIDAQITDENIFPVEESRNTRTTRGGAGHGGRAREGCSALSLFCLCSCPVLFLSADVKFPRNYMTIIRQIYKVSSATRSRARCCIGITKEAGWLWLTVFVCVPVPLWSPPPIRRPAQRLFRLYAHVYCRFRIYQTHRARNFD